MTYEMLVRDSENQCIQHTLDFVEGAIDPTVAIALGVQDYISFFFRRSIDDTVDCRRGGRMFEGRDLALDPYAGTVVASKEGMALGGEVELVPILQTASPEGSIDKWFWSRWGRR